jgi:sigma-B regulation protein RsbU (phosphoserine phosphatase)
MFVTLFVAEYVPATGRLRYVNGGHLESYVTNAGGGVRLCCAPTGTVVGLLPGRVYEEREERLAPGERLVAVSDGATEALSPAGEELGVERVGELARESAGAEPAAAVEALVERVRAFEAGEAYDDLTILVLARSAG